MTCGQLMPSIVYLYRECICDSRIFHPDLTGSFPPVGHERVCDSSLVKEALESRTPSAEAGLGVAQKYTLDSNWKVGRCQYWLSTMSSSEASRLQGEEAPSYVTRSDSAEQLIGRWDRKECTEGQTAQA